MRKPSHPANTLTKTDIEGLRAEIRTICAKRGRGDLTERAFQRAWTERSVDLFRALVSQKLAKDEPIVQEHHVIRAHFKITQSFLREPEQQSTSLFATDRRLIRLRAMVKSNQPVQGDESDHTVVDEINFAGIKSLKTRLEIRKSEAFTGLVVAGLGFFGGHYLQVTGNLMLALGLAAMAHAVLLPGRWVEVMTHNPISDSDPVSIYLLRKKSARQLVKYVRSRTYLPR